MALSALHVKRYAEVEGVGFAEALGTWRVPFALMVYGALATPYPLALCGYHVFLVARGETTREYLHGHKFTRAERHRPFSQKSLWKNFVVVLCRPRMPS